MCKKIVPILLTVVYIVLPMCLYAQNLSYISTFVSLLIGVVNLLVPIFLGIALVVFIWGLVVFIAKSDNEQEREVGKQKMLWGVIGLFVLASVWGLVLLVQTLTGAGGAANGLGPPGIPLGVGI